MKTNIRTFTSYLAQFLERSRQTMYAQLNIQALSCSYCCSGKAVNITYPECAFVAIGIQHEMRIRHIVVCGLPG
jgi:hypothetical protein